MDLGVFNFSGVCSDSRKPNIASTIICSGSPLGLQHCGMQQRYIILLGPLYAPYLEWAYSGSPLGLQRCGVQQRHIIFLVPLYAPYLEWAYSGSQFG